MRGVFAKRMMRGVMRRHPNAFLITLRNYGVTMPLHRSQEHVKRDIALGLAAQGKPPNAPIILVGHSQGGLAVLRYAIDHPNQVLHTFAVGTPWEGSLTAMFCATRMHKLTGKHVLASFRDMSPNSRYLRKLHEDLPSIAERVTSIYSTHELFIRPYSGAHIDVPGVRHVLIATEREYARHLRSQVDKPIDELIVARATHASEMNNPEVRSLVWQKVDELSVTVRGSQQRIPPQRTASDNLLSG